MKKMAAIILLHIIMHTVLVMRNMFQFIDIISTTHLHAQHNLCEKYIIILCIYIICRAKY